MNILLVDDTRTEQHIMTVRLSEMGHEVTCCSNGQEAIELYNRNDFDLVLMDVIMPIMDGHEAARRIRTLENDWVPIIFLSGRTSPDDIAAGIAAGGDDYLNKPVDETVLAAKMTAMQRIAAMRHRLISVSHELENANSELLKLANADGLTGLSNRRIIDQYLEKETARAIRSDHSITVIMMDLDNFKAYNDNYGHIAGDSCLKKVSKVLKNSVRRPEDLVGRYGGEEFCVILPNTDMNGAMFVAERIRTSIQELKIPHTGNADLGVVTISLGIASRVPGQKAPATQLLNEADKALYKAKVSGRNRVVAAEHE
jgi:diguanylate cyclase (GGDEF)-like protein